LVICILFFSCQYIYGSTIFIIILTIMSTYALLAFRFSFFQGILFDSMIIIYMSFHISAVHEKA